ncbi:MAG: NAD-dependent epimerase/dehydratase family protein, partial [Candidatus Portnoybacteria bacterium]|nr:NAD-dependent epimerase/dehydratase family protein [Candidatus Portnoybacteria bacterium]
NQPPMTEGMTPQPEDSYAIAKYAVEQELKISHEMFGLDYIIFRPHNVYGQRQNIGDKYRNVVGIFMNQIMQGLPITVFGDGEQKRAFTHIGDAAPVIAKSIFKSKAYNQIFNIGADEAVTVNKLAELVFQAMGKKAEIKCLSARNEVKFAYSDHQKVKDILGYRDNIALGNGLKKMAKWAKKAGAKKSKEFDNIEISKNLPPSWAK